MSNVCTAQENNHVQAEDRVRPLILVVDDQPANIQILYTLLTAEFASPTFHCSLREKPGNFRKPKF